MSKLPERFTIRVYGILMNSNEEVLLSHEKIGDFPFVKFPGGGLEFGEGPKDCLIREFMEETGITVSIHSHVYTSDFFVQSKIVPEEQVIGIYYNLDSVDPERLSALSLKPQYHPFQNLTNTISHRWHAVKSLKERTLTFPMDRAALKVLKGLI